MEILHVTETMTSQHNVAVTSRNVAFVTDDSITLLGNGNISADEVPSYPDIISLQPVRITVVVVQILTSLVAVIGNGLVLLVIFKRKKLRKNPTILFILNLAFTDVVSCLVYRPLLLLELCLPFQEKFSYPSFYLEQCKLASFLQNTFAAVGFLTMVAISQERLLLIVYPLKAKKICSPGNTKRVLVLIWIVAVCSVLPVPLRYTTIKTLNLGGTHVSLCGQFEESWDGIAYFVLIFILYFAIPLIVITISYTQIFHVLYRRPDNLDKNISDGRSMQIRRSLAKMMLSVSVIFALCWGPDFCFYMYITAGGDVPRNGFFITALVEYLPIVSSSLNPFVYTLNSRTFRKSITSMVLRRPSSDARGLQRSISPSSWRTSLRYSCNSPHLSHHSFYMPSPALRRHTADAALKSAAERNAYRRQISCPFDGTVIQNGNVRKTRVSFGIDNSSRTESAAIRRAKFKSALKKTVDSDTNMNGTKGVISVKKYSKNSMHNEHPDEVVERNPLWRGSTFDNVAPDHRRGHIKLVRYKKRDPDMDIV